MRLSIPNLQRRVEFWKAKAEKRERECELFRQYIQMLESLAVVSVDKYQISKIAKAKKKLNLFTKPHKTSR